MDDSVKRLSKGLQPVAPKSSCASALQTASKDDVRERYNRPRDLSKIKVIPARQESDPFNPKMRKRVVVYCRVSTDGISQTSSFELQKNYYLRFVRKKPDWKLVGLYSDEGITATSMEKRVGLLTLLEDARAGKFDIIVVKNLSRLARNLMDCMNIIYELRALPHPIGILFETENMFTLDKNVDFTLQVLSLVAQEESHKKSEAMNSSYQQRFGSGQFTKPDLLGYDSVGVNEIAINEEEAQTVQLIFMMFLAGIHPSTIADVLVMLGRKTHTHKYKDGRIKEGVVKWTANSVSNVLRNERRCGDVLAQKTYTPNYLDHKPKKNENHLPQYYAKDQHPAIVAREDFHLVQRILEANRGGWKFGLPELGIYERGPLGGFVTAVPNWRGFTAEDYNRAALRANGVSESELDAFERRLASRNHDDDIDQVQTAEFQHAYAIDSDDYDQFPEDAGTQVEEGKEEVVESYRSLVESMREGQDDEVDKRQFGGYDLSGCEVVRPHFFNVRDKISFTADSKGIYFNQMCSQQLEFGTQAAQFVELAYNPVERLLVVRKSRKESDRTIRWIGEQNGNPCMRRCTCRGISGALYENMGWNANFKYRVLGSVQTIGDEDVLVFFLDESMAIVPAKAGSIRNIDTDTIDEQQARDIVREGYLPEQGYVPDLSDFELGNGPMATSVKKLSRSRAIYYDELTEKTTGELHVSDLGDRKYDPECVQRMIQKGIEPAEGWLYLKGMAVIRKNYFTILPMEWSDGFGEEFYQAQRKKQIRRFGDPDIGAMRRAIPYGWTVGLDLPTERTVQETIEILKNGIA